MQKRGHPLIERRQSRTNASRVYASSTAISREDEGETFLNPVIDDRLQTPPASPQVGDRYIVPCGATGVWSGRAGSTAEWVGNGWEFSTPPSGSVVWVSSELYFTTFLRTPTTKRTVTTVPAAFWFPHHFIDSLHTPYLGSVSSRLTSPPGSPALFEAFLITSPATGVWTGFEGKIAISVCNSLTQGRSWAYVDADEGQLVWVEDENLYYIYNGAGWIPLPQWIGNRTDLDDIADVNAPSPDTNDVLTWDGSEWVPLPTQLAPHTLGQHTDTNFAGLTDGMFIRRVSGVWVVTFISTDDIDNDSSVPGVSLTDALDNLQDDIDNIQDDIQDIQNDLSSGASNPGVSESIRMIRGKIGLAFPTSGAGWSAVRLGLGNYQVTWTTTVPSDVTLMLTPGTSITGALFGYSFSPGGTPSSSGFIVAVYRWNGATWDLDDVGLSFLAVWGV